MAALASFSEAFEGEIVLPGSAGYDAARIVWNGMIDRRPAVVARAAGVEDVRRTVRFAREQDLPIAVRCGGHSLAGFSTCDDGVVLDLSLMRDVHVDPARRTARVAGGTLLSQLDAAAQAHGLVCPVGVVGHTGVAGLTLGGGMGRLQRHFGFSIDNLRSVELVTADDRVLTVSEDEEPRPLLGDPRSRAELRGRHIVRVRSPRARPRRHAGVRRLPRRAGPRDRGARPRVPRDGAGRGHGVVRRDDGDGGGRRGPRRSSRDLRRRDPLRAGRRRRGSPPSSPRPRARRRHVPTGPLPRAADVGRRRHGVGQAVLHEGWVLGRALGRVHRRRDGTHHAPRRRHALGARRCDLAGPRGHHGVHRPGGAVLARGRGRLGRRRRRRGADRLGPHDDGRAGAVHGGRSLRERRDRDRSGRRA